MARLLIIIAFICMFCFSPVISEEKETYIVHVNKPVGVTTSRVLGSWYQSFLPKTKTGSNDAARMIHSYRNVVTGFSAKLSPDEAKEMEKVEGFVSARPQRILAPHTTHSPNFMGLHQNFGVWQEASYGKGVIVGMLDTGITPGHPSFNDEGVPPPPAKWKGKCELSGVACNNKLIGARNFVSGLAGEPVDLEGHGTHTASTAAGNFVPDANFFGIANGTAVGMAPHAHLAIYKVCSESQCAESDILAAMDAAIEDGVDVLSLSLGAGDSRIIGSPFPFYQDGIATGAFVAMQKGIFVSCSAGNSGPFYGSLENDAPWILTVGASTIDRNIRSTVILGNNDEYDGESLFQLKDFPNTLLPLVYAATGAVDPDSVVCAPGKLNSNAVKGKVVLCERGGDVSRIEKGQTVKDAGGVAMILMNDENHKYSTEADAHVLPASHVSYAAGKAIQDYIKSTSNPTATILFKGTVIGSKDAPAITSFSSRGPSLTTPGILKPDIIGPGVNILAAWRTSMETDTKTQSSFNIVSGTSMSCPHLSGIAALLRSSHPDWSPAAIKSAMMTTADILNVNNHPINDERMQPASMFSVGAGQVNPSRANNPGLVYDIQPDDYIPYLCGLGYNDEEIEILTQHPVQCASILSIPEGQLNYPSFNIHLGSDKQTYTRTVTNVGKANSTYYVDINSSWAVDVNVQPSTLNFTEVGQKMTYKVSFSKLDSSISNTFLEGSITWISDENRVRSPVNIEMI